MLRPDFCEIFDFITKHSSFYSINTNGTLITREIAGLMRRQGDIMVSIYGATADVHDHITRAPGSFEKMVRGLTLLKERSVSFAVQIVPMRDNYHQYEKMIEFAKQFSPNWRLGAAWLFLSAFGDVRKNSDIRRQRLDPKQVIDLEHNIFRNRDEAHKNVNTKCKNSENYLLKNCILDRNMLHIDPYGGLTFCSFIYDPRLRYDLKNGTFQKGWEDFLPSLVDFVRADDTYEQNCGSCRYRPYCWNCPAYSYLENRTYTDKTDYLCAIAGENKNYIEKSRKKYIRIFSLTGVKVQFESELPILESFLLKPFIDREETQIDNSLLNNVVDNVHFFELNYNINDDVRYCLNSQSKLYYYHIFEGLSETEHSKTDDILHNELNTVRGTKSSDHLSTLQQRDFRSLHLKKRLFYIAGLSLQVDFNWPEDKHLLDIRFKPFQSEKISGDLLRLEHYIGLPNENSTKMGKLIYQKVPWIIYETRQNWIYVSCSQFEDEMQVNKISFFDKDYSFAKIYHKDNRLFKLGNWTALTSFPSDQIWLQQILPQRGGFFIHSSALVLNDQGLVFVGHSEAGKSTMSKMLLKSGAELLCDDRNILKKDGQEWNVYGTWSHGELPMVSSAHAPLFGVFILQKSDRNHIDLIKNQKQRFHSIIECIIRPFVTLSWWDKVIPLIHQLSQNMPVFQVEFNQDGKIVDLLHDLVGQKGPSLRNTMDAPPIDRL